MADKKRINMEMTSNPEFLVDLLNSMDTEIDALRSQVNILTDADQVEAWAEEVDGDLDDINDYLDFKGEPNGVNWGDYTLTAAAQVHFTGAGVVSYRINGENYFSALDTTVEFLGVENLAQNKYRAYRLEINKLGAVTLTGPGDIDSDTAENALLTMCSVAKTANTATLAYVVSDADAAAFIPGTTNTDTTSIHTFYYTRGYERQMSGITIVQDADLAIGTTPEEYSIGTLDYKVLGLNVAQDAEDLTCAFPVADTITGDGKFGAHLIVTNLAQNLTVAIAGDGIAETVSNMTYASAALAEAAMLECLNRLPDMFAPVGYIIVESGKAVFEYTTDSLAALGTDSDSVEYVTFGVSAWDRLTDGAATLSEHGLNAPTINASVADPIPSDPGAQVAEQTEQGR